MAWMGYYEIDGQEIINVSRTEKYASANGIPLRAVFRNSALGPMLGQTYTTPIADNAPWIDPAQPESSQFLGLYPLSITGIEDATTFSVVTESVLDGGVASRPRSSSRTIVFSALIVATTDCGAEYGMRWLRNALQGAPCAPGGCTGSTLCYLRCEPGTGSTLVSLERSLHRVTPTLGPTISRKSPLSTCSGEVWQVDWTMVAGMPYEFASEKPLVANFNDGAVNFYVNSAYNSEGYDSDGVTTTESVCLPDVYRPVYDPACPQVIAPPPIPGIPVGCFDFPTEFERRFFTIPKEEIPTWGQVVPTIEFKVGVVEVRNLRLRFYSDVLGLGDPNTDPCGYCGDIVFSYLPAGSTFIFDGVERTTQVLSPGNPARRADAVVFKSDGTPFDWPELACGVDYLVTLDLPAGEVLPTVSMSLTGKVA